MPEDSFQAFVTDQLSALPGLRSRRMFGGVGYHQDDTFFAFCLKGKLYFRVNDANRPDYESRGMCAFRYDNNGTMTSLTYYEVPLDILEHPESLILWAQRAVQAAAQSQN